MYTVIAKCSCLRSSYCSTRTFAANVRAEAGHFCLQRLYRNFRQRKVRRGKRSTTGWKIVAESTAVNAQNAASSGIVEDRTKKFIVVDDVVKQMADCCEARWTARSEKKHADRHFQQVGENSCAQYLQRTWKRDCTAGEETSAWKTRQRCVYESNNTQSDRLNTYIERWVSMEDKKTQVEERRLNIV